MLEIQEILGSYIALKLPIKSVEYDYSISPKKLEKIAKESDILYYERMGENVIIHFQYMRDLRMFLHFLDSELRN